MLSSLYKIRYMYGKHVDEVDRFVTHLWLVYSRRGDLRDTQRSPFSRCRSQVYPGNKTPLAQKNVCWLVTDKNNVHYNHCLCLEITGKLLPFNHLLRMYGFKKRVTVLAIQAKISVFTNLKCNFALKNCPILRIKSFRKTVLGRLISTVNFGWQCSRIRG